MTTIMKCGSSSMSKGVCSRRAVKQECRNVRSGAGFGAGAGTGFGRKVSRPSVGSSNPLMRNMPNQGAASSSYVSAIRVVQGSQNNRVIASAVASSTASASYSPEEMAFFADLIKKPILTENTTKEIEENKYYFEVSNGCTKNEIKQAVETLFSVKVIQVNTMNPPVKRKVNRMNGKQTVKRRSKRAIVTLMEGDTIPLFEEEEEEEEGESAGN